MENSTDSGILLGVGTISFCLYIGKRTPLRNFSNIQELESFVDTIPIPLRVGVAFKSGFLRNFCQEF